MHNSKYILSVVCFFIFTLLPFSGGEFVFLNAQIGDYEQYEQLYTDEELEESIKEVEEIEEMSDFNIEEFAEEAYNSDLYKQIMEYHGFTDEDFTGIFELNMRKNQIPKNGEDASFWIRTNLNKERSMFTWYVNGEIKQEGYGLDTLETDVGEVGEEINVEVHLETDNGIEKADSISFVVGDVDIIWQANTYTPTPYKGKPLSSRADKGVLEVVALPDFSQGKQLEDPDKYVFSWRIDGGEYKKARGMNAITLDLSEISRRSEIQVMIQPLNSDMRLTKSIPFPKQGDPDVLMYTEDNYGIDYNRAINYMSSFPLEQQTVSVKAEPMFFTKKENEKVKIEWSMNNEPIPDFAGDNKANFSIEREFTGKSSVSVSIENKNNLRERVNSKVMFDVDMVNSNL